MALGGKQHRQLETFKTIPSNWLTSAQLCDRSQRVGGDVTYDVGKSTTYCIQYGGGSISPPCHQNMVFQGVFVGATVPNLAICLKLEVIV